MQDYKNLPGLQGRSNRPGLTKKILLAPVSAFDVVADVADPNATGPERVTISGDHTFLTGQGFTEMYTTLDTGKLMAESIGERDGRGHSVKVECFHPGTKAEAMAFAETALYDEFILLVEELEGEHIQVGDKTLGADVLNSFDTGTVSSGRKGYQFTFESFAPLRKYEGAITMKPETV